MGLRWRSCGSSVEVLWVFRVGLGGLPVVVLWVFLLWSCGSSLWGLVGLRLLVSSVFKVFEVLDVWSSGSFLMMVRSRSNGRS